MADLGQRILAYRAEHNMTQQEFGYACGLTGQTIMCIEHGKSNLAKLTVEKISRLLDGKESGNESINIAD